MGEFTPGSSPPVKCSTIAPFLAGVILSLGSAVLPSAGRRSAEGAPGMELDMGVRRGVAECAMVGTCYCYA